MIRIDCLGEASNLKHMTSNQPGNYFNGFPFCSGLIDEHIILLSEVRCGFVKESHKDWFISL